MQASSSGNKNQASIKKHELITLLINTTGDYYNNENIKEVMASQITSSVFFYQMIEKLIADGVDTFIEIGPKKTLSGFVKKIDRKLNIVNIEDLSSLDKALIKMENQKLAITGGIQKYLLMRLVC